MEQSRASLAAVFDTAPLAALWWRRDGAEESPIGQVPGGESGLPYAGVLAGLDSPAPARLETAVDALRHTGQDFATAVGATDGKTYQLHGRETASGDSVLWLADLSAQREAETDRDSAL